MFDFVIRRPKSLLRYIDIPCLSYEINIRSGLADGYTVKTHSEAGVGGYHGGLAN
jgi:hypothetical protein